MDPFTEDQIEAMVLAVKEQLAVYLLYLGVDAFCQDA